MLASQNAISAVISLWQNGVIDLETSEFAEFDEEPINKLKEAAIANHNIAEKILLTITHAQDERKESKSEDS